jgi:hypothetical protein
VAAVNSAFKTHSTNLSRNADDALKLFCELFGDNSGQACGSGNTGVGAHPEFAGRMQVTVKLAA